MSGWPSERIGTLCKFDPSKSQVRDLAAGTQVSFVPMNDLGFGSAAVSGREARPVSEVYRGYTYFADGDVLLAKITPCFENGKLGVAAGLKNEIGFGSSEFMVLRPGPRISARYLAHYLSQDEFRELGAKAMTGAVGHKRVPKEWVQDFEIPLPPLAEQQRIVDILDEAFEGVGSAARQAEANLANAADLQRSCLESELRLAASGKATTPLESLCANGRPITYGVVKLGDPVVGGTPCLRTSNVRWLTIDQRGLKSIDPALSGEYRRTILRGGEVLVNVRGTLGGVAVVPPEMAGWNISREVAIVPNDAERSNSEFLAFWIGSQTSQKWLTAMTTGAAYVGINIADLRDLPVPGLSLAQQEAVVQRVQGVLREQVDLMRLHQRKLALLAELKQSLLARAFSGELTREPLAA